MKTDPFRCSLASLCSGCDLAYEHPNDFKKQRLSVLRLFGLDVDRMNEANKLEWVWIASSGLRDRFDFVFLKQESDVRIGLYARQSAGLNLSRELVDLPGCPQLSIKLEEWFKFFRSHLPPLVSKGSIRLRTNRDGLRGVWLDLANTDIRDLLQERNWIEGLIEAGVVVEMGQKRKTVLRSNTQLEFNTRTLRPWIHSLVWIPSTQSFAPAPIFSTVGSFSQPGVDANQKLLETFHSHLNAIDEETTKKLHCLELGSGSGNLTLAILSRGHSVHAIESDAIAIEGLEKTLAEFSKNVPTVHDRILIQSEDAIQKAVSIPKVPIDCIVLDPPRSGLKFFFDAIQPTLQTHSPALIYVSCYPKTFSEDLHKLQTYGYAIEKLSIVEQFPFSSHFELVATLRNSPRRSAS